MENLKTKKQPRVLIINDMSCFGKCSLTVALPIISSFNIEAVPLPTAILSTHTGEFQNFTRLDMTGEMKKIINHFIELELKFDCIYTGYFCNDKQLKIAKLAFEKLSHKDTLILVDPVMADNGELYTGFDKSYIKKISELCSCAEIITPNMTEAAFLADISIKAHYDDEDINECLHKLLKIGCKKVVITGIKKGDGNIGFVCVDGDLNNRFEIFYPGIDRNLYGCGDTFASSLCGALNTGIPFEKAVKGSALYMNKCIQTTLPDIENHWYGLKFEQHTASNIFLGGNI